MQRNNKKKICIVVSSLGRGGAEKSNALLSIILFNLGYNVHIVSILDIIDYSYKGELINLGELKNKNDSLLGKLNRFCTFYKYLKRNKFDLIIDSRSRPTVLKQFFINKILYRREKVNYIVHSYNLINYLPKNLYACKYLYNGSSKIICVSNEIKNKIEKKYKFENIQTIYNAIDFDETMLKGQKLLMDGNFVLFYGRIVDSVKNISLLIEGYRLSLLKKHNIKLIILGDGNDTLKLKEKVAALNLSENILFVPYTKKPYMYIEEALFTLLTSKYEGFPRVLIESLALGTPVISVNCKSGPSEIVSHKKNGLLIENNSPEVLANAMNNFIFDKELYQECKTNAKQSVQRFSMDCIAKNWEQLIENIK